MSRWTKGAPVHPMRTGGGGGGEVLLRRGEGVGGDVGGPPDDGPVVRVRLPEERVEGLVVLAERGRLRAQAPLLEDHVPLAVELAEHGVEEPVRLQPGPQL